MIFFLKRYLTLIFFQINLVATAQSSEKHDLFNYANAISYGNFLSHKWMGRSLNNQEKEQLTKEGYSSLKTLINAWIYSPRFTKIMQVFLETLLTQDHGEYDALTLNTALHIITNDQPLSQLIEGPCFSDGKVVSCDSGAPYTAGILTTRGFLSIHKSRYNLARAASMTKLFLCTEQAKGMHGLQTHENREELINLFSKVYGPDEAKFFNGSDCHQCHGLFAPHSQLFVKFSKDGLWNVLANGIQDENEEIGLSQSGFYSSHYSDKSLASSEGVADFLGAPVANLKEAGSVIVKKKDFWACFSRHILNFTYGFDLGGETIPRGLTHDIADHLLAEKKPDSESNFLNWPTFRELFIQSLTHGNSFFSYLRSFHPETRVEIERYFADHRNVSIEKQLLEQVIEPKCGGCHGLAASGGVDLRILKNLINTESAKGLIVDPNNIEKSRIWQTIIEGSMPPGGSLSKSEKTLLSKWLSSIAHPN